MGKNTASPAIDDLVERLEAGASYLEITGEGDPKLVKDIREAADRITVVERELEEAENLRNRAQFHSKVLEAQNAVLRRQLDEARRQLNEARRQRDEARLRSIRNGRQV